MKWGERLIAPLYASPIKRSITIAGHETALSLEPLFWEALSVAATEAQLPVNALIARIDAERIVVQHPPNLASAVRCWLFNHNLRVTRNNIAIEGYCR